jgi:ribosomal protein S18 acetylase RimI-like enzyme
VPGDVAFRYATAADIPALHALIERCYRGDEARKGWTYESDLLTEPRTSPEELAELIASDDRRFVLAEQQGPLVGCVLIERRGDECYFGMLSIDPALQSAGLGKALLAEIEANARELWRSRAMTLVVINLRAELIAWYQRRGYRVTGHTEPFPTGIHPPRPGLDFHLIEMRKAL